MTECDECLKCHFYTGNDCGECEGQEESHAKNGFHGNTWKIQKNKSCRPFIGRFSFIPLLVKYGILPGRFSKKWKR